MANRLTRRSISDRNPESVKTMQLRLQKHVRSRQGQSKCLAHGSDSLRHICVAMKPGIPPSACETIKTNGGSSMTRAVCDFLIVIAFFLTWRITGIGYISCEGCKGILFRGRVRGLCSTERQPGVSLSGAVH